MRFPVDDLIFGDRDVQFGEIGGAAFHLSASQFEYWKPTQLIIDVVPGRGDMFSLETGEGVRFHLRPRVFDEDELPALRTARRT